MANEATPLASGSTPASVQTLSYLSGIRNDLKEAWWESHQAAFIVFDIYSYVFQCDSSGLWDKVTLADTHARSQCWWFKEHRCYTYNPSYWAIVLIGAPFEALGRWSFRTLSLNRFDCGPVIPNEMRDNLLFLHFFRVLWSLQMAAIMTFSIFVSVFGLISQNPTDTPYPHAVERETGANLTRLSLAFAVRPRASARREPRLPYRPVRGELTTRAFEH